MAIDFRKLFSDKNSYADTLVFKVGDAEVSLGDLRQYNEQVGGDLQKELDRQRTQLANEQAKLNEASDRVAKMYIELETEKGKLSNLPNSNQPPVDPLARYERDEVFGPVVQHVKQLEDRYNRTQQELMGKVDNIIKSVGQMGVTYMGNKAKDDYESIMRRDDPVRPKDLSLDALYKFAVESRIYDRNNLPDLNEAYDRLTNKARHQYELAEAEKRGRDMQLRDIEEGAMLPRPSSGLPPVPEGFVVPKNMNDAFNRAMKDRDMFKQINSPNPILGGSIQ